MAACGAISEIPVREIPLMWFVSYCIADAPLEIGCTSAQSVTLVIKQALRVCLLLADVKNFWVNVEKRLLYERTALAVMTYQARVQYHRVVQTRVYGNVHSSSPASCYGRHSLMIMLHP